MTELATPSLEIDARSVSSKPATSKRRRALRALRWTIGALIYLAVLIAAWQLYVSWDHVPFYLLPRPHGVWTALRHLFVTGQIWPELTYTCRNIIIGFFAGVGLGITLGWTLWSNWWARQVFAPHIILFQAAPKIAVAPLLVLWFGLGLSSQLALIIMLAFFPMMIATLLGLASVDPELEALGRLFALSRLTFFLRIQLPAASPALFAGAKISIIDALTGAFLAEYLTSQRGLGYLMDYAHSTYNTPLLFAAVLLTVAVGLIGFGAITLTERRFLAWRD
jgi:NitT/TauT family transport system permease protein